MAIHHPTPPLGGGERPRLPSAQEARFSRRRESLHKMEPFGSGGPVTQAIRAMRAAEPILPDPNKAGLDADLRSARLLSRTEVEGLVEGLIDLLDAYGNVGEAA